MKLRIYLQCFRAFAVVSGIALTAACSGGSDGPVSTPRPAPTPTPTPNPTNLVTAEVERSDGPQYHGAITAWEEGIAGANSVIAVVDTGIDEDSPEFAGRIHPASTDIAGSRGYDAEDDHGTNVSMVAAAAKNDAGIVGIAYEAEVLALRADTPGTCATETPTDTSLGCSFSNFDIARGIDVAVDAGATVINLSLGGADPGKIVADAVTRAAAAGVVVVVASGNYGDGSNPDFSRFEPTPFASAIAAAGSGNVIIVGSVDEGGRISSFSNPAGDELNTYIMARGERICCVYEDGEVFVGTDANGSYTVLFSGTSFAAPQVAGAVALLKQAFPNLTGMEIVQLLLESARDAGEAGIDRTYGRGILDIAQAFNPSGTMTIVGTDIPTSAGIAVAIGSPLMGDALSSADTLTTIATDKYDRAFTVDLSTGLHDGAEFTGILRNAVAPGVRRRSAGNANIALAFTVSDTTTYNGRDPVAELLLSREGAEVARVMAGRVLTRVAPDVQVGFSIDEGANGLRTQLAGLENPAFLVAGSAETSGPLSAKNIRAAVASFDVAPGTKILMSLEAGQVAISGPSMQIFSLMDRGDATKYSQMTLSLTRENRISNGALAIGWIDEENTVLGGWFGGVMGDGGATTIVVEGSTNYKFAPNWSIGSAIFGGATRADRRGLIRSGSPVIFGSWSLDVVRDDVFVPRDSVAFRVSQPMRVEHGGLKLRLPTEYNYATESASFGNRFLSLEPSSREIVSELRWSGPVYGGWGGASLFYRRNPNHLKSQSGEIGAAASYEASF